MLIGKEKSLELPTAEQALPGRVQPMAVAPTHVVTGHHITPPFPDGTEQALFALGCFWGAERQFWQLAGVYSTAVGYAGGAAVVVLAKALADTLVDLEVVVGGEADGVETGLVE